MDIQNIALIIIDMQQGFMHSNTKHLVNKLASLLSKHLFDHVCFSQFINTPTSPFVKQLTWDKCMKSPEIDLVPELISFANHIFVKHGLGAFTNELDTYLTEHNIHTLILAGLETDACILKTALDAFEKHYTVLVLSDYCASKLGAKRSEDALSIIGKNIGYHNVLTLADFLKTQNAISP